MECAIHRVEPAWVAGEFVLWCGGDRLGDGEPDTPLHGCRNWSAGLAARAREHVSDAYFHSDLPALARRLLHHPLCRRDDRFDLSYLGMDSIIDHEQALALVIASDGEERLLWRRMEEPARDLLLPQGGVLRVVAAWVQAFDEQMRGGRWKGPPA